MHAADIPVSGNAGVLHVRRYLDFADGVLLPLASISDQVAGRRGEWVRG